MSRQLNVRSDEAYATAHSIADELGITTTEAVVSALREFCAKRRIPSRIVTPDEAKTNLKALMSAVRRANRAHPIGKPLTADDLYDEGGLPK